MPRLPFALLAVLLAACATSPTTDGPTAAPGTAIDSARVMTQLGILAADSMEGRRAGFPGGARARRFLVSEYARLGLRPFGAGYEHAFTFSGRRDTTTRTGVNVVGWVRGTERPERYIVVSAHYDHVGIGAPVNGDSIYNGADDDASGTAAVLEYARWFAAHPPKTSMIFALFDAEESGLRGSRAWVQAPPVPLDSLVLAMTMDMVSHSAANELVAAGTSPYPFLRPYVERATAGARVTMRYGHDTPDLPPGDEWLSRTDAGPFHAARVPALLFSVADHADYHRPSDEVRTITPGFYLAAVRTMLDVLRTLDEGAAAIPARRP